MSKRGSFARGICGRCRQEFVVNSGGFIRGHVCPQHPAGYSQGNERALRIVREAHTPVTPRPSCDCVPRLRQMHAAVEKESGDQADVLVGFQQAQRTIFASIIERLATIQRED